MPLTPDWQEEWDAFVDSMAHGTLFHKLGWMRVIQKTFSYEAHYLFAQQSGRICGVLPLFYLKSIFGGRALISTPFAVYGGILAKDSETADALVRHACELAEELGASYIELRHIHALQHKRLVTRADLYCTFLNPIGSSDEENLSRLPKEARRMVRKASRLGLRATLTREVGPFYDIYAESVRHHGTPVFPRSLFRNLLEEYGENADILLVEHKGRPVAGVLSFYYRKTVLPYYGGSLPAKNYLAPNNFMYYSLMNHAAARGCTHFDFGRSKQQTGAFHFKRHMGFQPIPLQYQYYLRIGAAIPNNNPTNPKFQLAIRIWRRLPLRITKVLGPPLVKQFP